MSLSVYGDEEQQINDNLPNGSVNKAARQCHVKDFFLSFMKRFISVFACTCPFVREKKKPPRGSVTKESRGMEK